MIMFSSELPAVQPVGQLAVGSRCPRAVHGLGYLVIDYFTPHLVTVTCGGYSLLNHSANPGT
jgi:hypothetical protein